MSYEPGANKVQYRCVKCGLVSPHNDSCFRCGGGKKKELVPMIAVKKAKGQGISVRVGS